MKCWLLGHKKLKLDIFGDKPFIGAGDETGDLIEVHLCERCRLLYWEVANDIRWLEAKQKQ